MSKESVQFVIGKAATDSAYRELLMNNPEAALEGCELEADEKEALLKLDSEKLGVFSQSLDERLTKGKTVVGG